MKKLLFTLIFLMMASSVLGATVERTISGNQVTITLSGYSGEYGGIISETIPTGYTPTGITSQSVGLSGTVFGKWENQLWEIVVVVDSIDPASFTYGIQGSGDGTITGSIAFDPTSGGQVLEITGDSQLGTGANLPVCEYANICDETDSCQNTRDTDGTVCDTGKSCLDGVCTVDVTDSCTADLTTTCLEGECTGLQTCIYSVDGNYWGACIKDDPECSGLTGDDVQEFFKGLNPCVWGESIYEPEPCFTGWGVVGIITFLIVFFTRKK